MKPCSMRNNCERNGKNRFLLGIIWLEVFVLLTRVDSFSLTFTSHHSLKIASHHSLLMLPVRRTANLPYSLKRSRKDAAVSDALMNFEDASTKNIAPGNKKDAHLEYYCDPNAIHPKTNSIMKSMSAYAGYVVKTLVNKKRKKEVEKKRLQQKLAANKQWGGKSWLSRLGKLNEQRKNLVALTNFDAPIVIPSFTILLIGAFINTLVPAYYSQCIQLVATLEPQRLKVVEALVGLVATSMIGALFTGLKGSVFFLAGIRANYSVRVKLHRNLLLQEAAFFDSTESGKLLARLNDDVNKIGGVISYHINVVCRQLAQAIFGSVFLLRISPRLAFGAFAGIAVSAWVSAVYGDFARVLQEKVQTMSAAGTAIAESSFSMSETVRAFNGVKMESAKYEKSQSKALELDEIQAWAYGTHKFVGDTLQCSLQALLLFACWQMGRGGGLKATQLTSFIFYTNYVLKSTSEVWDQWAKIKRAFGASKSVLKLLQRTPVVRDYYQRKNAVVEKIQPNANDALSKSDDQRESPIIKMSNMTLTYGAMNVPALKDIDLKINYGDRVAVVGRSGSGKSSMLRAILRFYDPSNGCIEVDGRKLTDMSRKEIVEKISVVQQEPAVFPMSLLDNVLYGIEKDDVDPTTGEACYSEKYRIAAAESLKFVGLPVDARNSLNLELDTVLGEGGRLLSGGQRQRIAISRILIRSPEVLLLDEPTAALDAQSEKTVIQALRNTLNVCKTMVMVTHRLSAVRSLGVNRVVVMDQGEIIEFGHPEDLLRKEGSLYASLAVEQGIMPISEIKDQSEVTTPSVYTVANDDFPTIVVEDVPPNVEVTKNFTFVI